MIHVRISGELPVSQKEFKIHGEKKKQFDTNVPCSKINT